MAQTTTQKTARHDGSGDDAAAVQSASSLPAETSLGKTTIADSVVQKIAGIAARDVSGVHNLGGGTARALGAIRERIPGGGGRMTQGVSVEVGERQAAVDLDLVVEYGVSIAELAKAVRRNVINAVERMTGLSVVEVNINIDDIHIVGEDDDYETRVK